MTIPHSEMWDRREGSAIWPEELEISWGLVGFSVIFVSTRSQLALESSQTCTQIDTCMIMLPVMYTCSHWHRSENTQIEAHTHLPIRRYGDTLKVVWSSIEKWKITAFCAPNFHMNLKNIAILESLLVRASISAWPESTSPMIIALAS